MMSAYLPIPQPVFYAGRLMQLFIMRHGEAETGGTSDAKRSLTEQGSLEVCVMAKWLKKERVEFDRVIISPFNRAQQTAAILLEQLGCSTLTETSDIVTPMGSAQAVHDYIDGVCISERIEKLLIVSHMPLVSYLIEDMTVERSCPIFQTAGVALIDYDLKRMKGNLIALTSPIDIC